MLTLLLLVISLVLLLVVGLLAALPVACWSWRVFVILPFGTSSEQSFVRDCRSLRGDRIGLRDHAILWGLFVARATSAVQIAVELFPGQQVSKARNQLNRLRRLGLVENHRGGRVQGSDPYLWTLTDKGFKALEAYRDGRIIPMDESDPVPCSKVRLGAFYEWGWRDSMPGIGVPGRVEHDLQTIDFILMSYVKNDAPYDEHILGVYSSEELAIEAANLASDPEQGGIKHYVLDELPPWMEGWLAERAAREHAESTEAQHAPHLDPASEPQR